jgi:transcriptional regulator with XRE-family HTH domain
MKIGPIVKASRIHQRLTLKELATKSGLTISFLSQLERGLVSPSISSLERIADAMGRKIGYFFEREENKELVFVKKGTDKKDIKEEEISYEALASGFLNIKMQPQIFTLGIKTELPKDLIYTDRENFGIVLKGKLEFLCGDKKIILEEGDSIYCACTKRLNSIKNISEAEAKLLWIVFVPP